MRPLRPLSDSLRALIVAFTLCVPVFGQLGPDSVPKMIGDFFDGSPLSVSVLDRQPVSLTVSGFTLTAGQNTDLTDSVFGFAVTGNTPDDLITSGNGSLIGGNLVFPIAEPLPPSEATLSPGGDFQFDGGTATFNGTQPVDGDQWTADYAFVRQLTLANAAGGGGLAVRRVKLSENNSPVPDSRVYFNYNFLSDVFSGLGDINRYVFGFERACACRSWSIDIRVPFAATLDTVQFLDGVTNRGVELGNASVIYKQVLRRSQTDLLSAGLGLTVPTADDLHFFRTVGERVLEVKNERVNLSPFLGYVSQNNLRQIQLFAQLDFDLNGNPVYGSLDGGALPEIGTLKDSTMFFLDFAYIYWMYRGNGPCLTGVAPTFELHYSTSLSDADSISADGFNIGFLSNRLDVLNATVGAHFLFGPQQNTTITPAFVLPISDDADEQFDFEFALLLNRRF